MLMVGGKIHSDALNIGEVAKLAITTTKGRPKPPFSGRHPGPYGARSSALQERDIRGLGRRSGASQFGKRRWRQHVDDVVARLIAVLEPTDVVIGGGNATKLKQLPPGCRAGDNANAFTGGFRMWEPRRRARLRESPYKFKS
jgi:hypothetical protein